MDGGWRGPAGQAANEPAAALRAFCPSLATAAPMNILLAFRSCCCCLLLALSSTVSAATEPHPGAHDFLRELKTETQANRASYHRWQKLLAAAKFQPAILTAISKPAEVTKTWQQYRPIFLTEKRLRDGIAFWTENRALLASISANTGVAPEIIVAIIGVETSYGRVTGNYRVLDALTTLAFYYPPRAAFFRQELKTLLRQPSTRFPMALGEVTGSYAGAMGWGQFMPSSYAEYARDQDGDGRIDLWNSVADIIASVANYFVAHGWASQAPVAELATVAADAVLPDLRGTEALHTVASLAASGYQSSQPLPPDLPATLVQLEGVNGNETWITHQNFYVITRYNRSPMYAMAVFQLSQQLAAAMTSPSAVAP